MTHQMYSNDLLSSATRWMTSMLAKNEKRIELLNSGLANGKFEENIRLAGRYAGRKPGWHIETSLKQRVINAGLGYLIQDFETLTSEDFDSSLERAEKQMMEQGNYKLDKRKLVRAACKVRDKCKFGPEKFRRASHDEVIEQINKQSSASFPHYRRKGQVMDLIQSSAERCLQDSEYLLQVFLWPQTRGFRLQLRHELIDILRKIRVMYPYPGTIIFLEDSFIIPFVRHFIATDTFYVIGRNGGEIGKLLERRFGGSIEVTSLDVSHFDQSVVNEAIVLAFWILRSQLKLSSHEHKVFEQICLYFMSSIMVSKSKGKPVYAFVKTHGIPSGSGFTNMIGTLVHAIIVAYLEPSLLDNDKCLLCADDNIFDSANINVSKLQQRYMTHFDMTINPEKTDVFSSSRELKFLGFKWINYVRHVDPKLVINQLLWHTDFLVDLDIYERELARGASVLLNGVNGYYLFKKIFPDVISDLKAGYDIRFRYLFGTAPLPTVSSGPPGINESLKEHLLHGWRIR